MGPILGSVPCQKTSFCAWNKLFLGEIKFSQRRTRPVTSWWWQIVPMQESTNEWKTLFLNNGTCGNTIIKTSNSEVPIDEINIEVLEILQNLNILLDSISNCFTRYKCIAIQNDSWINIHEWFGSNFPTRNIRNVCRARDDGRHYDVTSKCCGVTITTRLVEWTLSISEINAVFKNCQALKHANGYPYKVWDKSKTIWAVGIAQLTHHSVRGGGKNPSNSLWVNCAIRTAHVVSL